MNEIMEDLRSVDRNKVAALLSLVPGLGHLYKHHYLSGFGILIGGNILAGFISVLMILGSFGLSFFAPLLYVAAIAVAAYNLEDWHGRHHNLHPWRKDAATSDD